MPVGLVLAFSDGVLFFAGGCVPLLVLIHPRAPHNNKVFPTRQKGSDFLKDVDDVFDVVVWDDAVSKRLQLHMCRIFRVFKTFNKLYQQHFYHIIWPMVKVCSMHNWDLSVCTCWCFMLVRSKCKENGLKSLQWVLQETFCIVSRACG